jgi:hypothetical protein
MKRTQVVLLAAVVLFIGSARAHAWKPLVTHFGLGTWMHPIQDAEVVVAGRNSDTAGPDRRDHVHIFAVNGFNPLCLGNFNGLCDCLRKHGFEHTHFAQFYTCRDFPVQIRRIRQEDPQARIVLIGFSIGCNTVRKQANDLARDGTPVDLLVYLVGDYLNNSSYTFPNNVGRLVNVRAKGIVLTGGDLFFNGADIDGARNYKLDTRHILVPSRRETVSLVLEELIALTATPAEPARIVERRP